MNINIENQPYTPHPVQPNRPIPLLLTFLFSIGLALICFLKSDNLREVAMSLYSFPNPTNCHAEKDSVQLSRMLVATQRQINDLNRRKENLTPSQPYLIVNTTTNTFVLRTRSRIIREGLCSTGSYTLLNAGEDLQWIFKTPKGLFRIQGKLVNPLWKKPDWAFIEEGLPIPTKNHPDRFEYGTLGDYALSLGQGYLIHGTLYQRFLGLPVTHGCIRLGDEDLKVVFHSLGEGSRVYIF
jgi:hypothetical protein